MLEENPYAPPKTAVSSEEAPVGDFTVPHHGNYASRWARLGGWLIDMAVLLVIGATPIGGMLMFDSFDTWMLGDSGDMLLVFLVIGIVAAYLGLQSYFWRTRAQSIGKITLRTRIVMLDGSQATWKTIFWKRTLIPGLISMVPKLGDLFDFINAVAIFRREHNCLHDDIAKTRVISISKARKRPPQPERPFFKK